VAATTETTSPTPRSGLLPLLRRGQFARFFWAAALANAGQWMQQLSVPYAVYEITGSRAWLGTAALIGQLPSFVGNTVAGGVADRFDRKRLLLTARVLLTVLALAMWGLWASGHESLVGLLVLVFMAGLVGGFNTPVWQSFVPLLVERERLADAIRINSLQFSAARVAGPVVAGLVLGRFGPGAAFLTNALANLPVLAVIVGLRPRAVPRQPSVPIRQQVRDGWSYVLGHSSLLLAVGTISCVAFFGWSLTQLLPAIARDHFHEQPSAIGWLSGAYGMGMVSGVTTAASLSARVRRSTLARVAMGCWIAGMLGVAVFRSMEVGLAAFAIMGFGHVLIGQSAQVSLQVQVAEEYRGRVIATYFQGLFLGSPLGAFFLGGLSGWIGIGPGILVCAAGMATVFAVVMVRFGGFRPFDQEYPLPRRATEPSAVATAAVTGAS